MMFHRSDNEAAHETSAGNPYVSNNDHGLHRDEQYDYAAKAEDAKMPRPFNPLFCLSMFALAFCAMVSVPGVSKATTPVKPNHDSGSEAFATTNTTTHQQTEQDELLILGTTHNMFNDSTLPAATSDDSPVKDSDENGPTESEVTVSVDNTVDSISTSVEVEVLDRTTKEDILERFFVSGVQLFAPSVDAEAIVEDLKATKSAGVSDIPKMIGKSCLSAVIAKVNHFVPLVTAAVLGVLLLLVFFCTRANTKNPEEFEVEVEVGADVTDSGSRRTDNLDLDFDNCSNRSTHSSFLQRTRDLTNHRELCEFLQECELHLSRKGYRFTACPNRNIIRFDQLQQTYER